MQTQGSQNHERRSRSWKHSELTASIRTIAERDDLPAASLKQKWWTSPMRNTGHTVISWTAVIVTEQRSFLRKGPTNLTADIMRYVEESFSWLTRFRVGTGITGPKDRALKLSFSGDDRTVSVNNFRYKLKKIAAREKVSYYGSLSHFLEWCPNLPHYGLNKPYFEYAQIHRYQTHRKQ